MIVDDDPGVRRTLKWSLGDYDLITAADRTSALSQFRKHRPAVVALDMGLPPAVDDASEGLAILDAILTLEPTTKVIVVSGNNERENALRAIARGAVDFYAKPIDEDVLSLIIQRAFLIFDLEAENRTLRDMTGQTFHGIITADRSMQELCRMIEKIATSKAAVLIGGESGTGKELAARALHRLSSRADASFTAINCAAIPEALLESELFGHEKGAFTGADRQVKGKIELADGGTLFLDEIGDMPLPLQSKLLRFLEERQIERIGGRSSIPVDVRIISATHQHLDEMIEEGRFREDLYYRLAQLNIHMPPLRDRGSDVVLIARHFIERFANEQGKKPPRLEQAAIDTLCTHDWPGNIRELENRLRRAVIFEEGGAIQAADLDLAQDSNAKPAGPAVLTTLKLARERAEIDVITATLKATGGNISEAAKRLDISRPTLYSLIRQHGISNSSQGSQSA